MFAILDGRLPGWLGWLDWTIDREQMRRASFLARSPLFAGLPRRQLSRLATRFLEKAYNAGDVVFLEGDPGRALFVLVEGTVEITQATARGEHVVRKRPALLSAASRGLILRIYCNSYGAS